MLEILNSNLYLMFIDVEEKVTSDATNVEEKVTSDFYRDYSY